ncbi:MAG: DUF4625 domain-containing protein [Bacteroidales bacterium]|nr:DUF4625 domain-containing protein [Bacteroidales bacterium]
MKKSNYPAIVMLLCALGACNSLSTDKDMTPPEILPVPESTSPTNCATFHTGGVIPFNYAFTDDVELGSFNLEIHNNFDHHTHSTEATECDQEPKKEPVNAWKYNQDYPIPAGSTVYESHLRIPIPEGIDTGEYHFMIRVTDASGWQQLKSVTIFIQN